MADTWTASTGPPIILGCWVLALGLAVAPTAPRWTPWLGPAALAAIYGIGYVQERSATSGDPQPGLIMIVGLVTVAVATVLVVVGLLIRDHRARRGRDDR